MLRLNSACVWCVLQVALLRQALAQQQQQARAAEARATALEGTVAQLQRSNASLERLMRAHHTMEGVAANREGTPRAAAAGELAQAYQRIAELEQVRGSERRAVPPAYVVRCMSYDIRMYVVRHRRVSYGMSYGAWRTHDDPSCTVHLDRTGRYISTEAGRYMRIWQFAFSRDEIFT